MLYKFVLLYLCSVCVACAIGRETPLRGGEPIGAARAGRLSQAPEPSARATRGPQDQSRVSSTTLSMCQRDSSNQQPANMKMEKAEKTKPKVSETRKVNLTQNTQLNFYFVL